MVRIESLTQRMVLRIYNNYNGPFFDHLLALVALRERLYRCHIMAVDLHLNNFLIFVLFRLPNPILVRLGDRHLHLEHHSVCILVYKLLNNNSLRLGNLKYLHTTNGGIHSATNVYIK